MIETAQFGRTGHASTRVVFGGAAFFDADQETADSVLGVLREYGINHLDTAAGYGDSELRIAPWLVGHRDEYFLATKTEQRSGPDARASLERSLTRLGVDQIDLIQFHNLVEEDEWDEVHSPNGALAAMRAARDEGLVRFIGVTGHGVRIPRMHLRSLERFDYDSVLFPYNFTMLEDSQYRSDVDALLERCAERNVAVQTIKSIARRRWPEDAPSERRSWYQPIEDPDAIARAVHVVLGQPGLFLATSSDYRLLPHILRAAANPAPAPDASEMVADVEALGISRVFDGGALERI
jgi:aryl-alcohol dehydrogenase-like predicted oxidoreductase